jgi:multiple sugar transport system substrate-binding protein
LLFAGFALSLPVKDTLELWVMPNGPGAGNAIRELGNRFEEETKIHVRVRLLDWSEAFSEIDRALRGEGNTPDVFQLGSTWISLFASKNLLAPLGSMVNAVDSSRFLELSWELTHVENKSAVFSVPWFLDVRMLFANKAVLSALGINEGEQFTETGFRSLLQEISDREFLNPQGFPMAPFGLPGKDDWTGPQQAAPWIWSAGGDFVKKESEGWVSALLDSATLDGVGSYLELLGNLHFSPYSLRENSTQVTQRFAGSEQVFLMGTSEIIRKLDIPIAENGLKESFIGQDGILLLPFPNGSNGHFSFVGGSHLAIPQLKFKNAKARRLLRFLVRADNMDRYTRRIGFLPADKSILSVRAADSRYHYLIKEIEKNGRAFPNIPKWGDIENELIAMFNRFGEILRNQSDEKIRASLLTATLLETHRKINLILGHDSGEYQGTVDTVFVKKVLFAERSFPPFEQRKAITAPDTVQATPEVKSKSVWVRIIVILASAGVLGGVLFLFQKLYFDRKKWR